MDSILPYITIGSVILNLILLIFLLVLHAPQTIRTIRLFLVGLWVWLKVRPMAFNQWRWWKQYRPSCEIVRIGKLIIVKPSDRYYMELRIKVRYTSRDGRHDTGMDISTILLHVYNTGKGRDSKPYRLFTDNWTTKIHPIEEDSDGGFLVIPDIWSLPSGGNVVVRYTFNGFINAPPLVGASTFCKIVAIGKAKVGEVLGSRELKIDGKFVVDVDKEYEEQVLKHKHTA